MSKVVVMDSGGRSCMRRIPRRRWAAALAVAGLLAWAAASAWGASAASARLFSPNGVWNHPLAANARIDPHSGGWSTSS
jgi:hypothetical protein